MPGAAGSLFSSPAVAGGLVYVGSGDGHVVALNAATGAKRWTFTAGSFAESAAVANGVVYIGANFSVDALNAATGTRLWSFPTGDDFFSSPAVANGEVYICTDNLYAFGLADGLATPARPNQNSLHPDYNLSQQR